MFDIQCVVDALSILVSPSPQSSTRDKNVTSTDRFESMLVENMNQLQHAIKSDPRFIPLRGLITEVQDGTGVASDRQDDVSWRFVTCCLQLISAVQHTMHNTSESLTSNQALTPNQALLPNQALTPNRVLTSNQVLTPNQAPALSPDVLSVRQQKTILTALQFITCLGLCPNLNEGVGIPVHRRSGFASFVKQDSSLPEDERRARLVDCAKVFMQCVDVSCLGALILSRHLSDLLAALLQLSFASNKMIKKQTSLPKYPESVTPASVVNRAVKQSSETVNYSADNTSVKKDGEEQGDNSISSVGCQSSGIHSIGPMSVSNRSSAGDRVQVSDAEFCESSLQHLLDHVSPPVLVRELILLQGGPSQKDKKQTGSSTSTGLRPSPAWLRKACGRLLSGILMKPKGVLHVLRGMLDPSMGDPNDWRKCDAVAKIISRCPMSVASVEEYYKLVCPQMLSLLQPGRHDAGHFLRVTCGFMREVIKRHPCLAERYLLQPLMKPLLICTLSPDVVCTADSSIVVKDKDLKTCVQRLHQITVVSSEICGVMSSYLPPIMQPLFQLFSLTRQSQLGSWCLDIVLSFLKQAERHESLGLLRCLVFGEESEKIDVDFSCLHPSLSFHSNSHGGIDLVCDPHSTDSDKSGVGILMSEELSDRVDGLMQIIKPLEQCGIAGEFFLILLKELTEIVSSEEKPVTVDRDHSRSKEIDIGRSQELVDIERREEEKSDVFRKRLIILNVLASMCDTLGPSCLKSTRHILEFVMTTLQRAVQVYKQTDEDMTAIFETETISMAMGLLTAVMSGEEPVSNSDHHLMLELLPLLEEIHLNHPDDTVQEMATDIRIAIATRGAVWSDLIKGDKMKMESPRSTDKTLVQVLSETNYDSDKRSSEQPCKIKNDIYKDGESPRNVSLLCKNEDTESQATPSNHSVSVDRVDVPTPSNSSVSVDRVDVVCKSELQQAFTELCDPLIPVRGHALLTLTKLVQSKTQEAEEKRETILNIFLENLDHPDSYLYLASVIGLVALADRLPERVIPRLALEFADFDSRDRKIKRSSELRMKLGEALVKASRNLGDIIPVYRDVLLSSVLRGVRDDDEDVRGSSLSNLAEISRLLHFSLGPVLHEVFSCCSCVLKSDKVASVRMAAVMTLTSMLQGLGRDSLEVLSGVMRDLYRLMKHVYQSDTDPGVQLHAQIALTELDTIARDALFPQQTLQKKIVVLHSD